LTGGVMKLTDFLKNTEVIESGRIDNVMVLNGSYDSRKISSGSVFFDFNDGKYVSDALKRGAVAVVSEKYSQDFPCIAVKNVRKAFCAFCAELFSHPEKKLKTIAVVGTNGKTSTVKIIDHILKSAGYKTANIGTLGAEIDCITYSTGMTTPDTDSFFRLLDMAVYNNVDYVITELSAHAIYFSKCEGIVFDYGVFTNVSPDHLDFFKDMRIYAEVKKSVFLSDAVKCAVINSDDDIGLEIIRERIGKTISYGIANPADTFAIENRFDTGIRSVINCCDTISELVTPLCGEFNLYNILAAVSVCVDIGIGIANACTALSTISAIDGRYNVLYGKATVIIDYAHTPDGLKNVLTTARKTTKRRLIAVFGCGGNRDRQKRPVMGEIAAALADFTVITTDNPRYEDPEKIISEIVIGAEKIGKNYCAIADREAAVKFALDMAEQGDTVVVAGKGAEDYMEIRGERIPFSDKEICEKLLGRK